MTIPSIRLNARFRPSFLFTCPSFFTFANQRAINSVTTFTDGDYNDLDISSTLTSQSITLRYLWNKLSFPCKFMKTCCCV